MPVDLYIPGCPPRPEQILRAVMDLQAKIQRGGGIAETGLPELAEREQQVIELQQLGALPAARIERGDEDRFGYRLPGGKSLVGVSESR